MLVQLKLRHARLHVSVHVLLMNRQNAIHATHVDADAAVNRNSSTFDGGPFAKRYDWQCMPGADLYNRRDFFRAFGKCNCIRRMRGVGRLVAAVLFSDLRIDGQPIA
jgi:hypothetical protein